MYTCSSGSKAGLAEKSNQFVGGVGFPPNRRTLTGIIATSDSNPSSFHLISHLRWASAVLSNLVLPSVQ